MSGDFEITISNFKTLSTGVDGGHIYLATEIYYNDQPRDLFIYFSNKSDERKSITMNKLNLRGKLLDQGIDQPLSLLDSELIG